MKKNREKLWKMNQKLRQETGIVNNKSLKTDFDKRDFEIKDLQERIETLKEYHNRLHYVIERAQQVQMSKMTNWSFPTYIILI